MGIETKIKSLGVPQTKILEFSFSTGGHFEKWPKRAVPVFFWQHREYHSWESIEENDTTHGGSWGGGGVHGDPPWLMDYIAYIMRVHIMCRIQINSAMQRLVDSELRIYCFLSILLDIFYTQFSWNI